MAINDQTTDEIDSEIHRTPMTRIFDLGEIFEEVNDRFDDDPFEQRELVHQWRHEVFFLIEHRPVTTGH
jgi:hypothetical protein